MSGPVEVELKFALSNIATGNRLLATYALAGFAAEGATRKVVQTDRYVDTADGALERAGYACRFRTSADGAVITLKGLRRLDDGGVVHRREELEGPADPAILPAGWAPSAARTAVLEIAGDQPLAERVTVRQIRRKRNYYRDYTVVELSVDDVEVIEGSQSIDRFAELEAELREGDEALLEPLVRLLSGTNGLAPDETSKLERALEAVRRAAVPSLDEPVVEPVAAAPEVVLTAPVVVAAELAPPRLPTTRTPGTLADDHIAEAGRKALRFHLARMLAREPGARTGEVSEELHGMRVATRRQRAAWRVFGAAFEERPTARHRLRLRTLGAALGGVRDLDVLIEAAEAYRDRQTLEEGAAFDRLIRSWRSRRDLARIDLVTELDSPRYSRWLDDYIIFVQTEGRDVRAVAPIAPHRVRDTMPSRIWAAYEQVRGYEPVLRWADVTTLHDLRIAAKWLRYTIEFVREPLGDDAGPVIERIVAVQDYLGLLHDADVAAGLARDYLALRRKRIKAPEREAIGRYLADREAELARLQAGVDGPWRGVAEPSFRRDLGRLVAGL